MSDDGPRCICCSALRPSEKPREPITPPVCDGCHNQLRRMLTELTDSYAAVADNLEPGRRGAERMALGFGSQPPTNIHALNLLGPGTTPWTYDEWQIGDLPPLFLIGQWVDDWISERAMAEHQPPAVMSELTTWLLNRLGWAIQHHPAIDEFAASLSAISRSVRAVTQTGQHRGESAGRCPSRVRDDTRCATRLFVDPYTDVIACGRCGTSWHRRRGEWLKLRGEQIAMDAA